MESDYSIPVLREMDEFFLSQKIFRPMRVQRYDPGQKLSFTITSISPSRRGQILFEIEKFVGGGFAGQVYKVKVLDIKTPDEPIPELKIGQSYAIKILVPPSGLGKMIRNFLYALSFQGPFSSQVNPTAARAGALWQKLIRRGASLRLGSEKAVVDIFATFVDPVLGSCGEISEWVDGRMWRFEVDNNLDGRKKWKVGDADEDLNSPEYRTKRSFMAQLVTLMHDMGAHELARQYEWWTCKSQPNALKRLENDNNPYQGNVAVDFRAGMALLPFLPQCPADLKLIPKGILRGSFVQFDRGNFKKLKNFLQENPETFKGMEEVVTELEQADESYRNSLPDITHHHIKLFYKRKLWSSILSCSIEGWRIRKLIDEDKANRLASNRFLTVNFYLWGLIPLFGNFIRKLAGHQDYRRHYGRLFLNWDYFRRASRARMAEALIRWHRSGRISEERTRKLSRHILRFYTHLPLSVLPPKMHRFFSDKHFFRQSLDNIFARPVRLYFRADEREQWLYEMVSQGEKKGMLTSQEAANIKNRIKEPFIQKYLKSLAVHVCTVPVTQIVSVIVAIVYVKLHPELNWQEASVRAGLILGLFQVIPISPGSLVRGLYVTYLVIRERNFKDYNIAFFLSFFKYIGYLAFPIQMAYRYPDLARFMASHWATGAVHIVPIFGEHGALLEHMVFDIFYNYPLNLRRRIKERRLKRQKLMPRRWHIPVFILFGVILLTAIDYTYFIFLGGFPNLGDIWWLALWIPLFMAAAVAAGAGGAALSQRVIWGALSGAGIGILYAVSNIYLADLFTGAYELLSLKQLLGLIATKAAWQIFLFTLTAVIGAFIIEIRPIQTKKTSKKA